MYIYTAIIKKTFLNEFRFQQKMPKDLTISLRSKLCSNSSIYKHNF